jgi:hypothetical protein
LKSIEKQLAWREKEVRMLKGCINALNPELPGDAKTANQAIKQFYAANPYPSN